MNVVVNVHNLDNRTARFLLDVVGLFSDPDNQGMANEVRAGAMLIGFDAATGQAIFRDAATGVEMRNRFLATQRRRAPGFGRVGAAALSPAQINAQPSTPSSHEPHN